MTLPPPDDLKWDRGQPPTKGREKPPRHRSGQRFLKGPIPLAWLKPAMRQSPPGAKAAIILWYLAGLTKSKEVRPSRRDWDAFGMDRKAGYRGLKALASAGLISVDRHRGRCPIVTIHDVEDH